VRKQRALDSYGEIQDDLRIEGVLVEIAGKLHHDDEGTPEILAERKAVVRLFGVGITNNTIIAFTDQEGKRGDVCDKIKSAEFPVSFSFRR
jgi:hypothetical protein